jgi:hypothetical protein
MFQRMTNLLLICLLAIASLAACSMPTTSTGDVQVQQSAGQTTTDSGAATPASVAGTTAASTAATVLAENGTPYAADASAADSANAVAIELQGGAIAVDGAGVTVDGSSATITAAGTYRISGTLDDGQILVNAGDDAPVSLILSGATISSATSTPLYVQSAKAVEIVLADNTENNLTDGDEYVYASADANEPNAALFSDAELIISGGGSLTVNANYNDGISGDDGLTITGGAISVTAVDDGIRGKDYLIVKDGALTVSAGGDGLKSDNEEDATLGYIAIEKGDFDITAGGDGMQAETDLVVTDGGLSVVVGGGSDATLGEDLSAKGLKAGVNLTLDGGSFTVNAADDALHADSDLTVNGGTFTIASGDDGVHGETNLLVNGGDLKITKSYEGLEGANITLNAGTISVVSSDDGVNAASGDGVANPTQGGRGGGPGAGGNFTLSINGGTLVVDSGGDGVDANGSITMSGGLVIVNGAPVQMEGALDYDRGFTMSGGTVVAVGRNGMAHAPDASSSQNALLLYFDQAQEAGTLIHIEDSAGNAILTFAPTKAYQSLAFSSPELSSGETYKVFLGGSVTGAASNGLTSDGSYTGGAEYSSFTVSGVVTQVGSGGRFR